MITRINPTPTESNDLGNLITIKAISITKVSNTAM